MNNNEGHFCYFKPFQIRCKKIWQQLTRYSYQQIGYNMEVIILTVAQNAAIAGLELGQAGVLCLATLNEWQLS